MSELLANIVRALHALVVAFIILVPFTVKNKMVLIIHHWTCLSLIVHWVTNNDACCLTLLEASLRGKPASHTFIDQLIGSVYRMPQKWPVDVANSVSVVTVALGAYSLSQSYKAYPILYRLLKGKLLSMEDVSYLKGA